ncbi:MAG: hypothetical protein JSS02_23270 [Planctomycetes bacterium]|nr:hypothetical protein [Planctomycetota bacterium]
MIQNLVKDHGATDSMITVDLLEEGYIDNKSPAHTIVRERFRIRVFRGVKKTKDSLPAQNWIALELLVGLKWVTMVALEERNLQYVFSGLNKLFDVLESENTGSPEALPQVARRLPDESLFASRWYVTDSTGKFRNAEAPGESVDFE